MDGRNKSGHDERRTHAEMNYQHAFHAGNFADVHKHVVLTRILAYLRGKPAGFRVIDSHAGAGCYDLTGAQSTRSGNGATASPAYLLAPTMRAR